MVPDRFIWRVSAVVRTGPVRLDCAAAAAAETARVRWANRLRCSASGRWMSMLRHRAGRRVRTGLQRMDRGRGSLRRGSRQAVSRISQWCAAATLLPVFFHSPGGTLSSGVEIALAMRENSDGRCPGGRRQKAVPCCASPAAPCDLRVNRATMCRRSSRLRAPSVTRPAYSALAGATVRRIAPQAAVGVHASKSDERAWKEFVGQASRRAPAKRRAA